ncbi:membrane or secreted protein [Beggiatoa sp. PS]|nr:membrane or secreted protein [Beggiatoa sp. PS]
MNQVRLAVLLGSLLSAVVGYFVLYFATMGKPMMNDE